MFKFIEKSKNKLIDFYNTFLCVLQNSLTNETNFNIFVIRKQSIPPYSSILLNSDWPPKLTLSLLWLLDDYNEFLWRGGFVGGKSQSYEMK